MRRKELKKRRCRCREMWKKNGRKRRGKKRTRSGKN
jgi:hypothetical protein